MIPMVARIRIVRESGGNLRLWLPLFLVWIIALPFVLIALPIVCVVLWAKRMKAFRTISLVWELFSSLRGTHVETESPTESVLVRIY